MLLASLHWPLPHHRRLTRSLARGRQRFRALMAERRASGRASNDVLSGLLQIQARSDGILSDGWVWDALVACFVGSFAALSSTLAWACTLLAMHEDEGSRLRAEVDRVLTGRMPTPADLAQLAYTLAAIKEALRLYPPGYAALCVTRREVWLGEYHLRRFQPLILAPWVMHRRAEFFPNPSEFDPGRFAWQREAAMPPGAFVLFFEGPRSCLGQYVALPVLQSVLALAAQRFTFEAARAQHIEVDAELTVRPRRALRVLVRYRPR